MGVLAYQFAVVFELMRAFWEAGFVGALVMLVSFLLLKPLV